MSRIVALWLVVFMCLSMFQVTASAVTDNTVKSTGGTAESKDRAETGENLSADGIEYTWSVDWNRGVDGENAEFADLDGSGEQLVLHYTDWVWNMATLKLKFHIMVPSGHDSIPIGDVRFTLPSSLFQGWTGSNVDSIVSTIPKCQSREYLETFGSTVSENSKDFFCYYVDGDDLVLTNFREINGSYDMDAGITFQVDPLKVNG